VRKSKEEIDAQEAAKILGVSERMIRLYLDEKRLKGLKIAGKWFIEKASVESLRRAKLLPAGLVETSASGSAAEVPSEVSAEVKRRVGTPTRLSAFRLFNQWHKENKEDVTDLLKGRLLDLRLEAFAEMGAGYFSYGPAKAEHYQKARAAVGSIIGLLESLDANEQEKRGVAFLRDEIMPSFSSLLRMLDRPRAARKGSQKK
jgi:hypothetical protein